MTTYQILSLIGVGSLASAIITYIFTGSWKLAKKTSKRLEALCLGLQAVLRSRMTEMYYKYTDKGYAPLYAKQDFNNCWTQYETLGANGVMSDVYKRFMALPDTPPKEENSK